MCQHPGKWLFTGKRTQPWPGRRWKEEETTLKDREGWDSRCSSRQAPCGNPWSGPCSLGTAAALAEGVMDMTVRPLPRSQHSNPQAGVGAREGSQGAAVPARLLRLLGKGTW